MRVLHATTVHPASDARILRRECRTLVDQGYEVHLVAQRAGEVRDAFGVTLHGLSEPRSRAQRLRTLQPELLQVIKRVRPDIIHFHDPELIPLACYLKARGPIMIMDAHEDFPAQARQKDYLSPLVQVAASLGLAGAAGVAGRVLDGVVAATQTIARRYPQNKTVVSHNYPDLSDLSDPIRVASPWGSRASDVVYSGGISHIRGLGYLVDAMQLLPMRHANVRLHVLGESDSPEYAAHLKSLDRMDRVRFHGFLPYQEMARVIGDCRVGALPLLPTPNHIDSVPTKMFEYMALALPVVGSRLNEVRRVIDQYRCGLLVEPTDAAAIAGAVSRLLDDPLESERMGLRGQAAVQSTFNWRGESEAFVAFYRDFKERR